MASTAPVWACVPTHPQPVHSDLTDFFVLLLFPGKKWTLEAGFHLWYSPLCLPQYSHASGHGLPCKGLVSECVVDVFFELWLNLKCFRSTYQLLLLHHKDENRLSKAISVTRSMDERKVLSIAIGNKKCKTDKCWAEDEHPMSLGYKTTKRNWLTYAVFAPVWTAMVTSISVTG